MGNQHRIVAVAINNIRPAFARGRGAAQAGQHGLLIKQFHLKRNAKLFFNVRFPVFNFLEIVCCKRPEDKLFRLISRKAAHRRCHEKYKTDTHNKKLFHRKTSCCSHVSAETKQHMIVNHRYNDIDNTLLRTGFGEITRISLS